MVEQISIEVPPDYSKTEGYEQVLQEYERFILLRDFLPVFLCYCDTTKTCFVSKIFKRKTIESYQSIKIIK